MQFRNSQTRYGAVTKTFHWVIALAIITMLVIGFRMGGIQDLSMKMKVYGWHKSTGITILTLALLRIVWHLYSKKPAYLSSLKPWEKTAAHVLHFCLYAGMVCMPLSGWLMSSAGGRPVSFFGLFTLPDLIAKDEGMLNILRTVHWALAWCLIAGISAHVLAALKHYFIDKDRTVQRMVPFVNPEPPQNV